MIMAATPARDRPTDSHTSIPPRCVGDQRRLGKGRSKRRIRRPGTAKSWNSARRPEAAGDGVDVEEELHQEFLRPDEVPGLLQVPPAPQELDLLIVQDAQSLRE